MTKESTPPVITREEVLRFALAMASSPWALTVLPASWRRTGNGRQGEGVEWRDTATRQHIPRADVRERIADAVERDFGFTPTPREVRHLECVLEDVQNGDPLHQFVMRYFKREDGAATDLDVAWDIWKRWRPADLAMPQADWIAALSERGYRVEGDALLGYRKRKKTIPLRRGRPGRRAEA